MSNTNPWPQQGEFDDLAFYDAGYQAKAAFRPGLDTLANGDYDFEITDAAFDKVNNDRIIRVGLRTSSGRAVEYVWWLNDQKAVNRMGADLCVLGFEADKWGAAQGRSLATELPLAVPQLKGMKFRATKTSRQGTGTNATKTYHDLHISCRIDGKPMPPVQQQTNGAPAAQFTPQPAGAAPAGGDIPF